MENKIWKAIPGYEGKYEVSSVGDVRNLNFNRSGKIKELSLAQPYRGYYQVCLGKDGKIRCFTVHQLVAMAFLDHVPNGNKTAVDHINSDGLDNRVENLRVVTQRENLSKERTKKSGLPVGVYFNKRAKRYVASININRTVVYLGSYMDPESASRAYQRKLSEVLAG